MNGNGRARQTINVTSPVAGVSSASTHRAGRWTKPCTQSVCFREINHVANVRGHPKVFYDPRCVCRVRLRLAVKTRTHKEPRPAALTCRKTFGPTTFHCERTYRKTFRTRFWPDCFRRKVLLRWNSKTTNTTTTIYFQIRYFRYSDRPYVNIMSRLFEFREYDTIYVFVIVFAILNYTRFRNNNNNEKIYITKRYLLRK